MYRTPKACYRKAPVRRETRMERKHRQFDQAPKIGHLYDRLRSAEMIDYITINRDLVPGEAKYVKDVCRG
jgi:hypothetical protein